MDTLTSINVFRQVVESGSFVGAADRLDLSTAMVSKHVMAIEKRLRVRLLNRNSHKLSLTEAGSFYLERCKAILQDLQETELELESLSSAPCGTLRIACCDTCIPGLGLAHVLAEYRRRYPEVVLNISFTDRTVDLVEESFDLAFRIVQDESLPAGVVARRVRPVPFRLAASRAYLERHGVPKTPEELEPMAAKWGRPFFQGTGMAMYNEQEPTRSLRIFDPTPPNSFKGTVIACAVSNKRQLSPWIAFIHREKFTFCGIR